MQCKIEHSEDAIPEFLCRACHPELNLTTAQREQYATQDKRARDRDAQRQELLRAQQALTRAENAKGYAGIEARKATSLRKKIERLERELQQ